ncbi:MAG: ABC transporter ATP-binding protein [Gammaproteobacteria bacterium]|nr:ABC transporter ATP-binding protein [Gammaproteobacteria bacterium]
MADFAVQTNNVTRVYQEDSVPVYALRGITLSIERGEFVSVVGPSGSGKSTLLHVIGGLDRPTDGSVTIEDVSLGSLSESELTDVRLFQIGFVFQAYNLIPVLSAVENVEFILQLQGVGKKERRERAQDALRSFGLEELFDRRPADMSGGQQQRVAIARAVVSNPAVLLADEPSANLDSETTKEFCEYLQRVNDDRGVTIVTATHDPLVMGYTNRRVELVDGQIAA